MSVLAVDLRATGIIDANCTIALLQALGKVELDLAWRPLELTLSLRLRPLKPTMSKRDAGTGRPSGEREDQSSRACQESHHREARRVRRYLLSPCRTR